MAEKILVVAKDQDFAKLLQTKLAADDFLVTICMDIAKGIESAKKDRPDLAVVDLEGTSDEGLSAVGQLVNVSLKSIPVIALVGRDQTQRLLNQATLSDYIIKPFDMLELQGRIAWCLSKIRSEAERSLKDKQRKKILVVDDDQDFLDTMRMRLENEGFRVHTAANGEMALQEIEHQPPDLIILDVMMPKLDGFSTLKQINKMSDRKFPVIAVTGTAAIPEEEFRMEGVSAFLRKPVDGNVLIGHIKKILGSSD